MSVRGWLAERVSGVSSRSRAIGMFFATSLAARGLGVACQLLQVPIVVAALGSEAFGLWMTLTGIGAMITFADFGVGQGAQNKLAEAFAAGDERRARALWDSTLVFFLAAGLALAAIAAAVAAAVDFTKLFGLTEPGVRRSATAAVGVTLALFCLNFPLGLAQRLAYARQRGWTHNLVLAVASAGGLLGVLVATRHNASLPVVIFSAQLPLLLANAGLLGWQLRELGWWNLRGTRCRRDSLREVCTLGASFGIQQIQHTLFVSLPPLIISTQLGAGAVTPFNLAQRLFSLFSIVQNAFMLPLWPAYSAARAQGDFAWIRRTLRTSLAATIGCTVLPMTFGALFARPVLGRWVGEAAPLPTTTLIWLMFGWNALVFLAQPFGYLLAGMSVVRRLTQCAVVSSILSATLMWVLVHDYGAEGVVAGLILGSLPFVLRGNVIEAVRVVRSAPRPHETSAARPQDGRELTSSTAPANV